MLTGLAWLALETKSLEQARSFYADLLELSCRERGERELVFAAGETDLVVRRPDSVPRGGVHTHYAFSIPATEYDDWWDQLSTAGYDLEDAQFGELTSLYLYDPDGNCVELGQSDVAGPGIDGIFEVVLEVEDLERSQAFYAALGFETVDMGADRKRVRMSLNGSTALELWEPHLASPTPAAAFTSTSDSRPANRPARSRQSRITSSRSTTSLTSGLSYATRTGTSSRSPCNRWDEARDRLEAQYISHNVARGDRTTEYVRGGWCPRRFPAASQSGSHGSGPDSRPILSRRGRIRPRVH